MNDEYAGVITRPGSESGMTEGGWVAGYAGGFEV